MPAGDATSCGFHWAVQPTVLDHLGVDVDKDSSVIEDENGRRLTVEEFEALIRWDGQDRTMTGEEFS
jgi:hypothetical protein